MSNLKEFVLGGTAACGAGFFTNPLEVVKTRMQLQGELKARGHYTVHYKHVFHAFYAIGKYDGVLALQKGLVPALWYQFFMNGARLGAYQCMVNLGVTKNEDGSVNFGRSVLAGAVSGCIGAVFGSPIYMVKTQLQSASNAQIAVGYQHAHTSMWPALRHTYLQHGVVGLWRGVSAAVPRVMVGSAAQLATFSKAKGYIVNKQVFHPDSWLNAFTAAMISSVAVVGFMTPFDVVSTRLYNQGIDSSGRGLLYSSVFDCFGKIFRKEGVWGFYKGWAASLFRLGPHTVLSLVFWDQTRRLYFKIEKRLEKQ